MKQAALKNALKPFSSFLGWIGQFSINALILSFFEKWYEEDKNIYLLYCRQILQFVFEAAPLSPQLHFLPQQ
jgi:hypothetical protein